MSEAEQTLAILFADICGSTALFETTGNLAAIEIVGSCLDQLASVASEEGGRVVRSKGDDVLCTFVTAGAAFEAAIRMTHLDFRNDLEIHVGVHLGPLISARGDVFGDAVNVAARILKLANPGEILLSEDVRTQLAPSDQQKLRLLDRRSLKGKPDPIKIYTVAEVDSEATQFYP